MVLKLLVVNQQQVQQQQTVTTTSLTVTSENIEDVGRHCRLDNIFTLSLTTAYAVASFLTLFGVSIWSFKNMTSMLHTYILYIYTEIIECNCKCIQGVSS